MPSLLLCANIFADTIVLKNGKELKGLIVEQHEDRVILSTEKGEMPVPKRGIQKIDFDEPEQNFMQIGLQYEEKKRWGEALAYYEKALELNPELEDARKASVRVRNQFWTNAAAGPVNEIEHRQTLYDLLGKPKKYSQPAPKNISGLSSQLKDSLGMALERKEDWTHITELIPRRESALAGLKKQDRLVSIDGISLRYLNTEVVQSKLLSLKRSHFTLEVERDCAVKRTGSEKSLADMGLVLKLENQGMAIESVKEKSAAAQGGLKSGDLPVMINGASTRYMPIKKIMTEIHKDPLKTIFSVRRSVLLTRR